MRKLKNFLCIALLLPMIHMFSVTAAAVDLGEYDPEMDCSLKITLAEGVARDSFVEGAEVTIYRVADATFQDGKYVYRYLDAFADCGIAIPEQVDIQYAQQLRQYVSDHKIVGEDPAVSDKTGTVSFTKLKAGLYLVAQTGSVKEFTDFKPYMVYLPTAGEKQWHYEVGAMPKVDREKENKPQTIRINVRKVWNDNGVGRPESITVELLNGSEAVSQAVLSEQNGWQYSWQALAGTGQWSVREVNVPPGYTVTYTGEGTSFVINNTQKLIQTGQLQWPIPVLAGLGLLLITAGIFLKCRGKEPKS